MRIKSWVFTGLSAVVAFSAVAVVVISSDPADIDWRVAALFWAATGVGVWTLAATIFFLCRMSTVQAIWTGFLWAAALCIILLLSAHDVRDHRLLGGILSVTLLVSILVWFVFRHTRFPKTKHRHHG